MNDLKQSFFAHDNVVLIARNLLGKALFCHSETGIAAGIISETEAYNGIHDKACHAYNNRRTSRTETMFGEPAHAYIYLCYGIHNLFNIVTGPKGNPQAVLVRGIIPWLGCEEMKKRRKISPQHLSFSNGPGKVTRALNISRQMNGVSLLDKQIWLEDRNIEYHDNQILITPRIGVEYAAEDALLPYRFVLKPDIIQSEVYKYSNTHI